MFALWLASTAVIAAATLVAGIAFGVTLGSAMARPENHR